MMIRYLMDENLDPLYKLQILLKNSGIVVYSVGDPGTPPKGTPDPDILCWCEENGLILVTNNRKSMPVHLAEHLSQERHIPCIIILNAEMTIGETLEELNLIAEVGSPQKYEDQITYLPVT